VVFGQVLLRVDDAMQVSLHQWSADVDISKLLGRLREWVEKDVCNRNDVVMLEVPKQLDFTKDVLCIKRIVERIRNLCGRNEVRAASQRSNCDQFTFLMATFLPDVSSTAEMTMPYAP
jgi:hypothetical protein